MASARLAERTEFAGRGVVGHEIVRAGHDLEAGLLYRQNRRKRGTGKFPAVGTMAICENQDSPRAFVPHFSAIATACQHGEPPWIHPERTAVRPQRQDRKPLNGKGAKGAKGTQK